MFDQLQPSLHRGLSERRSDLTSSAPSTSTNSLFSWAVSRLPRKVDCKGWLWPIFRRGLASSPSAERLKAAVSSTHHGVGHVLPVETRPTCSGPTKRSFASCDATKP